MALRDREIGWLPKVLGVSASLAEIAPIEWIPGIHPLLALGLTLGLIPALLALAWRLVATPVRARIVEQAQGKPMPWGFVAMAGALFAVSAAVDTYLDLAYPGEDALSQLVDPWIAMLE